MVQLGLYCYVSLQSANTKSRGVRRREMSSSLSTERFHAVDLKMKLEDRLSDLPEGLLCEILSRMETRYAVRTCVLSKRWTRMWPQLSCLNLNVDSFNSLDSFQNFLLGFFTHYGSRKLDSIRFECDEVDDTSEPWDMFVRTMKIMIGQPTVNQVGHLSIDGHFFSETFNFPPMFFLYLKRIKLDSLTVEFPQPTYSVFNEALFLPENFDSIESDIIYSCTNLVDFFVPECISIGLSKIIISAPELNYLELEIIHERYDKSPAEIVLMSAPKITTLDFSFHCASIGNISVDSCPSLETASIDFFHYLTTENEKDILQSRTYAMNIVKFLNAVSGVSSLNLSTRTAKALSAFPELVKNIPSPFHNLKSLDVLEDHGIEYFALPLEVETFLVGASPKGSELLKGLRSDLEESLK
ncbi:hypothetical protein ACFE04_014156 [Oxalis oulophora]